MKTRSHEFRDECYNADFILVWPVDAARLCAFLKKRLPKADIADICGDEEGFSGWCSIYDKHHVIALGHWDNSVMDISTLSHECIHAALHVLFERSVPVDEDNHESLAYLQDSLLRRCLTALRRKR